MFLFGNRSDFAKHPSVFYLDGLVDRSQRASQNHDPTQIFTFPMGFSSNFKNFKFMAS